MAQLGEAGPLEPPEGAPMEALGRMIHAFAVLEEWAHIATWALISNDLHVGYSVTRSLSVTRLAALQRKLASGAGKNRLPVDLPIAINNAARDLELLARRRNRAIHAQWMDMGEEHDDPDLSPGGLMAFPNADWLQSMADPVNWSTDDEMIWLRVGIPQAAGIVDERELESLTAEASALAYRYVTIIEKVGSEIARRMNGDG